MTLLALSHAEPADQPEFQSVVFLETPAMDGNEISIGYCNGTLISANMILTAAHCLTEGAAVNAHNIIVQVGAYKYTKRKSDGATVRVGYAPYLKENVSVKYYFTRSVTAKIKTNGVKTKIGPSDDIGVIILNKPLSLPENFIFQKVITQKEILGISKNILGYWPSVVSINPFEEIRTTDIKRIGRLNSLSKTFSGYWESKSLVEVAPGDSGAPLFFRLGTEWKLGGITKGHAENIFSSWDVYGILDQKICEIAAQIPDLAARNLLCH